METPKRMKAFVFEH